MGKYNFTQGKRPFDGAGGAAGPPYPKKPKPDNTNPFAKSGWENTETVRLDQVSKDKLGNFHLKGDPKVDKAGEKLFFARNDEDPRQIYFRLKPKVLASALSKMANDMVAKGLATHDNLVFMGRLTAGPEMSPQDEQNARARLAVMETEFEERLAKEKMELAKKKREMDMLLAEKTKEVEMLRAEKYKDTESRSQDEVMGRTAGFGGLSMEEEEMAMGFAESEWAQPGGLGSAFDRRSGGDFAADLGHDERATPLGSFQAIPAIGFSMAAPVQKSRAARQREMSSRPHEDLKPGDIKSEPGTESGIAGFGGFGGPITDMGQGGINRRVPTEPATLRAQGEHSHQGRSSASSPSTRLGQNGRGSTGARRKKPRA